MRLVTKILIGVGALVAVPVILGVALVTFPQINEVVLKMTCSEENPTPTCVTRMRAMGHVWSLKHDLSRARDWYQRAAEHGDVQAMFHLGWIYEQWALVDVTDYAKDIAANVASVPPEMQNFTLAADAYRKAANKGHAPAMNNLGELYFNGAIGQAWPEEGFRWILRAAEAGNPVAAMNVAMHYRSGWGVSANEGEAERWSTWRGDKSNPPDLSEPTLERTTLQGQGLPPQIRDYVRHSVETHQPVTTTFRPLRPNPSLPTFRSVKESLGK